MPRRFDRTLKGFNTIREGRSMSQSLAQVYLHVVFSTKERRPFLQGEKLQQELHAYMAGTCKNLQSPAIKIGGVEDHVHILCRLGRTIEISDLVRELKRESSKWLKPKSLGLRRFHWQDGYGAFSVSPSHVKALTEYIETQAKHHKRTTFQHEFRRILKKYDVEYDERYVWD